MKTVTADLEDFATDFMALAARTGFRLERRE
jgi:hypothetical protein